MTETSQSQREALRVITEREVVASIIADARELVAELGTGACACLTRVLAAQGFRVLALDRDYAAVADAERVLAKDRLLGEVTLMQADATMLPLRSGSIRTVVAYNAFHHVEDLDRAVAEIARALHPRGRLHERHGTRAAQRLVLLRAA